MTRWVKVIRDPAVDLFFLTSVQVLFFVMPILVRSSWALVVVGCHAG